MTKGSFLEGICPKLQLLRHQPWLTVVAAVLVVRNLLAALVQMFQSFFMSHSFEVFGPGGMIMPVMVLVMAAHLVMLAVKANRWTS